MKDLRPVLAIAMAGCLLALVPAGRADAREPVRKYNFTIDKSAVAPPAHARQQESLRIGALFDGETRRATPRRDGRIYANGRYLGKTIVTFRRGFKPGTIYVNTAEKALYYVLPGGKAIKYGVGVGREGFTWKGRHRITMKKEWPEWRPPEEMKIREWKKYGRRLPDVMKGGPENPLGARALYIGNTLYRIHGTNNPRSIGRNVSSGCIRMVNEEVIDLYDRVRIGAPVIVE
jgi:lipoprotein-anchoring transpeptidase ErfK/SrfK